MMNISPSGKVIKTILNMASRFSGEKTPPAVAQEKVLVSLLSKAKDTEFGQYFKFNEILHSSDPLKKFSKL